MLRAVQDRRRAAGPGRKEIDVRAWMFAALLVAALGISCGGDFGYPAAEKVAVAWTATPEAQSMFQNLFVLKQTRDFHVTCATALPLTDDDKAANIAGAWCVTVGFSGRCARSTASPPPGTSTRSR